MAAHGWFKGIVKAVPSGDSLLIMCIQKEIDKDSTPLEKLITLSWTMAPRLARKDTNDDPFAWDSREFLRKKCIGQEVTFRVDYQLQVLNNRECATVHLGDTNIGHAVVANGWAKVRQPPGVEKHPFFAEFLKAEEQAKEQGLGIWNKAPGASEASIRSIPPSAVGDSSSSFDAQSFLEANKGKLVPAIVEQVRDGSSFRVYLIPSFQFVQVHLAGVQAPSMGKGRPAQQTNAANGDGTDAVATAAQRVATAPDTEPEEWARAAKHFTESRILNREVRVLLEGTDKNNRALFGSVNYLDGDKPVDLALQLLQHGLARYVDWSANLLEEEERRRLKAAEMQAKKDKLRFFTNFVITSNSQAIKNDVFTGKVVEVFSGDSISVTDESAPSGSPSAERRIFLSSIAAPKRSEPFSREAKEFLRTRLVGQEVRVSVEYSRTNAQPEGVSRVLEYGSVFLTSPVKGDATPNVGELILANGFASVVKHRYFDDRSHHYDSLLAAEKKAISAKKGKHGPVVPSSFQAKDLTLPTCTLKEKQRILPFLQKSGGRLTAMVDYVSSGHRFKVFVKKETCMIPFSLSGVRAPKAPEAFSNEATAFMRNRILQRDVEIEVETMDRNGIFLGSLWDSKGNVGVALLEAGLAKMQSGFADRITEGHLLMQAQEHAKKQRLKVWEAEEIAEVPAVGVSTANQEPLEVEVVEVLGGGKFYVQLAKDKEKLATIQQTLQTLTDKPTVGFQQPKKGDLVAAPFFGDDSWYRAMVVNTPKTGGEFEIFYIDYGNAGSLPLTKLRPLDASLSGQGLAHLCSLAYLKVPNLEEDFGVEAAEFLSGAVCGKGVMKAKVEETDLSGGKVRGQGTGPRLGVTMTEKESEQSINAIMLEKGLARLEKASKRDSKEKQAAVEKLSEHQDKARKARSNIWMYGDVESDEDEQVASKRGGRR